MKCFYDMVDHIPIIFHRNTFPRNEMITFCSENISGFIKCDSCEPREGVGGNPNCPLSFQKSPNSRYQDHPPSHWIFMLEASGIIWHLQYTPRIMHKLLVVLFVITRKSVHILCDTLFTPVVSSLLNEHLSYITPYGVIGRLTGFLIYSPVMIIF